MSKLFLIIAFICLFVTYGCVMYFVWAFPDIPVSTARIFMTSILVFFPNIIIYCTMEDKKK